MPAFTYFPEKNDKIPEFYVIFAWKNAQILNDICPQNIFSQIFFGEGATALLPSLHLLHLWVTL